MNLPREIETKGPASIPTCKLRIENSPVSQQYEVGSIVVMRQVNKIASAELLIYDGDPAKEDFAISAGEDFVPGKAIEILSGYRADDRVVFKGIIVSQGIKIYENKPSELRVVCKHEAVKTSVGRKVAYYYNKTDSAIIQDVFKQYKLNDSVSSTPTSHPEMVQYHASDWDFVVSRAEANGLFVFTEDDGVRVAAPDFGADPSIKLLHGATILSFEAEMDARTQFANVVAHAWQPATQEMEEVTARNPQVVSPGNLDSSSLSGTIELDQYDIRHAGLLKGMELQDWANAQWLRSQLAKVRGRVRFQGVDHVLPGQMIELGGLGTRFNGKAYVTAVRHELSLQNWETDVTFGLDPTWFAEQHDDIGTTPAEGLLPAVSGLQIGIVTKLEADPDGEDRIRVRMPMLDPEGEGVWARVACLDAGENRGTFFRPEINDEVVVGFLNDDPRHPVVLGHLNSSSKPAPVRAEDVNHKKGIYTRSEMKLVFNDDEKSVTIVTPASNSIVISDQNSGIILSDQHGNRIVMDAAGICLESASDIKLKAPANLNAEAGANAEIKAGAQLTAKGSAGAEVSTGGQAVLKGSIVQIN